jgi:hypothetical protein
VRAKQYSECGAEVFVVLEQEALVVTADDVGGYEVFDADAGEPVFEDLNVSWWAFTDAEGRGAAVEVFVDLSREGE